MAQIGSLKLYLLLFFCIFTVTKGNLCTPGLVTNIYFNQNSTLTWSPALNPNNCSIRSYVINVYDVQNDLQFQFQTSANETSYSFIEILGMCKSFSFEVHALTDAFVLGPSVKVNGTTLAPSHINLSLALLSTNMSEGLDVTWNLREPTVANCVTYYRVVYWDLDNKPVDIYVSDKNFTLPNVIPCMTYHVQVNAIVLNPDVEGPIGEVALQSPSSAPAAPKFVEMSTTRTENTMYFTPPTFENDPCILTALTVVTIGAPENSSVITVPITDNILRPAIKFTIPNLKPDSVYVSYVSLQNNYGSSKNITVSFQTDG